MLNGFYALKYLHTAINELTEIPEVEVKLIRLGSDLDMELDQAVKEGSGEEMRPEYEPASRFVAEQIALAVKDQIPLRFSGKLLISRQIIIYNEMKPEWARPFDVAILLSALDTLCTMVANEIDFRMVDKTLIEEHAERNKIRTVPHRPQCTIHPLHSIDAKASTLFNAMQRIHMWKWQLVQGQRL
jgi:hypothetical protein